MGIYRDRTEFINKKINEVTSPEDKRLLSVGFIPETLFAEYNEFMQNKEVGTDEDIDKISNGNYFSLHHDKIAGEVKAGTGFLNPILIKGTIEDVLQTINKTLGSPASVKVDKDKVESDIKQKAKTVKTKPMPKTADIKPEVEITKRDISLIVKNNLIEDDANLGKTQTTEQTVKKYNPTLTLDEIKAWVYHKRKFGNPMKGWEKYFIAGGKNSNTLLKTIKDTMVKDNKYADLRTIPANTIIGAKTKFHNTYGTENLVICKTATGELLWVNTADVKEFQNNTGETQSAIDGLVLSKALIFDGNEYYPKPVYLFGNIYEKINILKENKELIIAQYGEQVYSEQLALIESYKPKLKSFRDVVRTNRPHILCLSQFANDTVIFGVKELNEETGVKLGTNKRGRFVEVEEKISLFEAFKYWMDEFVKDTDLKGTTRANIKKYYFAKSIGWEKDESGKDVLTGAQKDELIGNARIAAEALFSDFLSTSLTFEDAVALDVIWNEKYNAFTSVIQFVDQVPIGFDGSTMFKDGQLGVKPAQRQGLAYLQLTGSGCLAYDVGFGKTLTGILNIAQLMSQGAIKRPLVVVPKPTYKNWLKELFGYWTDGEKVEFKEFKGSVYHYGVFSGVSGIKVNDWYNLSGNHYKKLLQDNGGNLDKLVPENTITVLSYKGFEQIGFSRNISSEMFDSIARVIMQKEANEDVRTDKKAAKEKVSFYQKVQGWLGIGNKNSVINIDTCGFDHITVDEAHNFKNVFAGCGKDESTGRKLFGIQATQSSRAVKMFFITNYIQAKHGKKVVLLTATPFTNSPLEIYSMLSFIGLETLNNYSLFNIKKFFEQFILQTIEYAIDAKGEIITKPVIKSFQNIKLLQTILYNHFHYKDDPKEAGVVRPCKIDLPNKDINTYLEMNEWQRKNQGMVKMIAKTVSRDNPGAVLKAINMSLNNAFSPYLFDKSEPQSAEEFVLNSPKINYAMECIKGVKEWHEARGEECSGMILYSNRGKEYFDYIKDYLIDTLGFKSKITYDEEVISEVEILTGGGSEAEDDRKELIKDAFNAGIVKIIIGTATIREGINLQTRGTVLFDLYPEWNPTDIVQLKGRIWRQGNKFGYVRFVMPLVINSMDGFLNQKLDEKSKRIANLWGPIGESNVLENEQDLDPSEIKYALVDDAVEKFKMKYDTIKAEMQRDFEVLNENKKTVSEINYQIEELKTSEERIYNDFNKEKGNWAKYLKYLESVNIKALKEADLNKTIKDIERVTKYTSELLEAVEKYFANRYDIALLLEAARMLKMRDFNVFTDYSNMGKTISEKMEEIVSYRSFDLNTYYYERLVRAYSVVKKAEKSVLNAYGKSWLDDLSDISKAVDKKLEALKMQAETIQSEDYKKAMVVEIEAEMEAAKQIRGDLYEQVGKFASLNHILSYLSDNTDKEGCPIPEDICCPTNGFTVIHADKEVPEPIQTASAQDEINSPAMQQMLREAIADIKEVLPDLKGADKKMAKEALADCEELLNDKMFWGGPVKQTKDWLVVYTVGSGKKRDLEMSSDKYQTEADVQSALNHRSDLGIYKINSITELKRSGGPVSEMTAKEFLDRYFGANVYPEEVIANFEVISKSISDESKAKAFIEQLKKDGFTVKKKTYSDFTAIKGAKKKMRTGGPVSEKWVITNEDKTKFITARFNMGTGENKVSWTDNINLAYVYDNEADAIEAEDKLSDFGIHDLSYSVPISEFKQMRKGGPIRKDKWSTGAGVDMWSFVKGDEVYLNGIYEPFGMVTSLGNKNVMVKRHKDGKIVPMAPTKLWVGKNIPQMKNGGPIDENEGVDLFEDYENIPAPVQEILDRHQEAFEDGSYNGLAIALSELNEIGYTFDYYLDGVAYDLRKIGQKGKLTDSDEMRKGGPVQYEDLSKVKPTLVSDSVISSVPEIDIVKVDLIKFEGKNKVTSSETAANVFREFWSENSINVQEHFNVLLLNRSNRPIGIYQLSKGGIDSTIADIELISAVAVKALAKGVIVAHNHPSGELSPSEPDKNMTKQLKEALKLFHISLLDSMILAPSGGYYSFLDEGIMRQGGPVRPKFAERKDHKYYNKAQGHERVYAKTNNRKKLTYKLSEGGPVVYKHKHMEATAEIIEKTNKGYKVKFTDNSGKKPKITTQYFNDIDFDKDKGFFEKMRKGGPINNEPRNVQFMLEDYTPEFEFNEVENDSERTRDGQGGMDYTIEFTDLSAETMAEFEADQDKFENHFKIWALKNDLYYTGLYSTDNSIMFKVTEY